MIALPTSLLEQGLKKLGCDAAALATLREEGHCLWRGKNGQTSLLVPSLEGEAVFIVTPLTTIDPEKDGRLLALALHLNLSPAHTQNTCIALDVERNSLCLRHAHDLTGHGADQLLMVLDNLQSLGEQLRELIEGFRRTQPGAGSSTGASNAFRSLAAQGLV